MSKETRTIRPFVGIEQLKSILDEPALYFGQESCRADKGLTVTLGPHEFLLRPVSVEWASDDEAFESFKERLSAGAEAVGIDPANLSIVAVANTSFLKISEVVFRHAVSEFDTLRRVCTLANEDGRARAFSAPFSGFSVDLYLLLSTSIEPMPLTPHKHGTWIASARFRVDTTHAPAVLPPTPLTDEVRGRLNLERKTIRFLYFGDHDVLEPYTEQERPVFYIDEKLLAQMNARRASPASKALQLQLAQDFTAGVIRRASVRAELSDRAYEDVHGSLLGSVIRIAAGPGAQAGDRDRLLAQVKDDPEFLIARAEHFIDVASGFGSMLKGDD